MPRMGGYEVYEQLRSAGEDVLVLLMTGYSAEVIQGNFNKKTGAPLLQKPYSVEALGRKVRGVFSLGRCLMKKVPVVLCVLIATILSFPLGTSFAQQQGVIRGTVTDRDGNPVYGIKVIARNTAINRETSSDSEGKYQIELPDGTYEVSAGTDCNQSALPTMSELPIR